MRPQHQQHHNNKRMRGRNRGGGGGKGPNPLSRSYESNGPDVKIRGTAQHVAEKYLQLSRDAQASGDRVMAESYMQHAEHYFRLLAAAQAQFAPHLPAYVRPDEQFADDDEEFDEIDPANPPPPQAYAPEAQFQPQGGFPSEQQQQPPQQQQQRRDGGFQGERRDGRDGFQGDRREFRQRDRFDRRDRFERGDRFDRGERPQGQPQGDGAPRAEGEEQPSVEFPRAPEGEFQQRRERAERGDRFERGPRRERLDRPRAPEAASEPDAEAPAPAPAEPAVPMAAEGEPGLPSFLTRTRRRGRPAYRRRDGDEGGEGEAGGEAPSEAPAT
jgi:hypothetical protein